jgi:hypothetical protein
VGAFVLGYLSPGPLALEEEGEDEVEDWMRETVANEPAQPVKGSPPG